MNYIDVLIVISIIVVIVRGSEAGLVRQVCSLSGLLAGIILGSIVISIFHAGALLSLFLIAAVTVFCVSISEYFGFQLKEQVSGRHLHKIDGVFGGILGVFIGLLFIWFSSSLVSAIPSTKFHEDVRDSKIIAWLDDTLPPATQIVQWLNKALASTRLPGVVKELEPTIPNLAARVPDIGQFNKVIDDTRASVVEIEGRSCNGLSVGSGFVAQNNVVITNAHVVAGMLHPYIQDEHGRHSARVIGFDPDLDIAVLHAGDLTDKPLLVAPSVSGSGTQAVAMGYPGGGPLTAVSAVIVQRFTAANPNIYNEGLDKRDVYALKADIEPGNSGGPLINSNAQVVGVVFARSTVYNQVGYALSTPAVLSVLQKANTQPSAGESTRCTTE